MVERHLAKVEVAGSSPVIRSKAKEQNVEFCSFALESFAYGAGSHQASLSPSELRTKRNSRPIYAIAEIGGSSSAPKQRYCVVTLPRLAGTVYNR